MNCDVEMSEEVCEKIEELRRRAREEQLLTDVYDTHFNLYRWLLGWNMDVEKTYCGLRKHLMIRRAIDLDACPPPIDYPVIRKYQPVSVVGSTGVDRNGILLVDMLGQYDPHGMLHAMPPNAFWRDRMYGCERVLRDIMQMEAINGKRGHCIAIADFRDFSFDPSSLSVITGSFCEMLRYTWDNYPELITKVLCVNAPSIFATLWSAVKAFVPERTRAKMEFGDAYSLPLKYVDIDRLPIQYGGTMVDENNDSHCSQYIVTCTKPIPKEYWGYREYDGTAVEKMKTAVIRKGATLRLAHVCSSSRSGNTKLRLDMTCDSTLHYSLFYCTSHSRVEDCSNNCADIVEYIPSSILPYMKCMYDVAMLLKIDGTHVWYVCLSNEKNWLRSANVAYDLYVVK